MEVDLGSNPGYPPTQGPSPPPPLPPPMLPRLPHLADLSPELQYEINVGPAGNERSPQEIEEEGGQKKNSARSHRTDFWHVDVPSPPCLVSHICLLLRCSCDSKRQEKSSAFLLLLFFVFFLLAQPSAGEAKEVDEERGAVSAGPCLCCSALKDNMTPSDPHPSPQKHKHGRAH